jgi:hypothetical protein
MKRTLLLALLLPFMASAADVTVSWTHPTSREDGTLLAVTEIASTKIEWGLCSNGTYTSSVTVPAPATSKALTNIASGVYCFRAYTTDVNGLVSAPSAVVQKALNSPPKAPVLK